MLYERDKVCGSLSKLPQFGQLGIVHVLFVFSTDFFFPSICGFLSGSLCLGRGKLFGDCPGLASEYLLARFIPAHTGAEAIGNNFAVFEIRGDSCHKKHPFRALFTQDEKGACRSAFDQSVDIFVDTALGMERDTFQSASKSCKAKRKSTENECFQCFSWWRQQNSNLWPSACEADALPAELCLHSAKNV